MKKQLHSNWRDDLREIVDISSSKPKTQTKSARRIEDKEVNNKVKINPVQQEEFDKIGGIILEVVELTEKQFTEADSIAAMRERAAKRRQQRYGKQGGGGRDDFRPYTKADYERGEANDPRKKEQKEEVELDERSLSKGEEKDREKYVKGMKKSAKDFKARYGDDYESVMYATATKMAKEERDPEKEVMGRKVADLEKKKTAFGIVKKFRQENPGSRQPKKVPGQKETEAQAENRRRGQQASRAAKYGLTSKEKKETQSRDKYYSSRD